MNIDVLWVVNKLTIMIRSLINLYFDLYSYNSFENVYFWAFEF